jgi:hypothetical protein
MHHIYDTHVLVPEIEESLPRPLADHLCNGDLSAAIQRISRNEPIPNLPEGVTPGDKKKAGTRSCMPARAEHQQNFS